MESHLRDGEANLTVCDEDVSCDDVLSESLLGKYISYIKKSGSDAELDSEDEYLPNDDCLREKYAQVRSNESNTSASISTSGSRQSKRLSTGIPAKYKTIEVINDEDSQNSTLQANDVNERGKAALERLYGLIEKLKTVRRCGLDGNSIFCTQSELDAIQEGYGKILDLVHESTSMFETRSCCLSRELNETNRQSKDDRKSGGDMPRDNQEDQSSDNHLNVKPVDKGKDTLAEKITSVKVARDKFYEVEQQVKDYLEQLELVERYKMESVG